MSTDTDLGNLLREQTEAVNWKMASKLHNGRTYGLATERKARICAGCGKKCYLEYVYPDSKREFNCHDCAWPKNGDYLRADIIVRCSAGLPLLPYLPLNISASYHKAVNRLGHFLGTNHQGEGG
jgi:hypothetical protein